MDARRAIFVKELRDYRRDRFVMVFTMTILPLIFIAVPIVRLLTAPAYAAAPSSTRGSVYRCCRCC